MPVFRMACILPINVQPINFLQCKHAKKWVLIITGTNSHRNYEKKKKLKRLKQANKQVKVHAYNDFNDTSSAHLSITICKYFNNNMDICNEETENHLKG